MSRSTIDFGIDLGTTNSAVAVARDVTADVVKNNEGDDTTPSAVLLDERGRLYVGRAAREQMEARPEDTAGEFKLLMGTAGAARDFAAARRSLTPEELSAEVLKSLRADVREHLDEDIRAAVITVPAAFDLNSCDATRRAARLAGLSVSPLIQEPTAAAHAYGFQATHDTGMWLVYDLGGGTFDAALIRVRDGELTVVGHSGDTFLGGKLIDWGIVDELLIPAALRQSGLLAGLTRGDRRWYAAVNQLKQAAERAKIRLSRRESEPIRLDLVVDRERRVPFEYELRRAEVERLTEPLITRSTALCRAALAEHGVNPADVTKVILVGGPTQMPYLRQRLTDDRHGLGIPLAYDQDPMTVVARGAALFAAGQPLPADPTAPPPRSGTYRVRVEYPRVGPDTDPLVLGTVAGPDAAGLSIELVNTDTRWRSGRTALAGGGEFAITLNARRGRRNTFTIEVTDAAGTRQPVTPETIEYTVGAVESQPLLTHTIGVGDADNHLQPLLERNSRLPARRTVALRTTATVQAGQGGGLIRIPVLEGEQHRADRNRRIGRIEVTAAEATRTLPAGSEVRFTLVIDESRIVTASVYVPLLDATFHHTIDLATEPPPEVAALDAGLAEERARLAELRRQQATIGSPVVDMMLAQLDQERPEEDVQRLLPAAATDPEAAKTAGRRLLDLRIAVDAVEDELAWPSLVREAESRLADLRTLIEAHGTDTDRADLPLYERTIQDAISARGPELLRQRMTDLAVLARQILERTPAWHALVFQDLARHRDDMRSTSHADRLIAEGNRALDTGEQQRLPTINMQLSALLPEPPPPPNPFSTIYLTR